MINIQIIACCDSNRVIGKDNNLLYSIHDDLKRFKKMTLNQIVIMGYNTFMSLPKQVRPLPDRFNIILSRSFNKYMSDDKHMICSYDDCFKYLQEHHNNKQIFVIGGSEIYHSFINFYFTELFKGFCISKIHLTQVLKKPAISEADKDNYIYFPYIDHLKYVLVDNSPIYYDDINKLKYCYLTYENKEVNNIKLIHNERQYLNQLSYIMKKGHKRNNRTGIDTISIFGGQLEFDISNSIPILTTKFVPVKGCIEELLWFLRGDTNAKHLQEKGVKIWDGNSSREFLDNRGLTHIEEGDIGAGYGFQWRHFGANYINCNTSIPENEYQGIDQINEAIRMLKEDPYSRRIIVNAWNAKDLDKMALVPCHMSFQFYVEKDEHGQQHLSCHMYQRSCDMFLGEPWNIFSYALLTYIFGKKTNMKPKKLIISFGDCHIYENHINQVKEQLSRQILVEPKIILNDNIIDKDWNDITVNDFNIIGYFSHPSIKAMMAI